MKHCGRMAHAVLRILFVLKDLREASDEVIARKITETTLPSVRARLTSLVAWNIVTYRAEKDGPMLRRIYQMTDLATKWLEASEALTEEM